MKYKIIFFMLLFSAVMSAGIHRRFTANAMDRDVYEDALIKMYSDVWNSESGKKIWEQPENRTKRKRAIKIGRYIYCDTRFAEIANLPTHDIIQRLLVEIYGPATAENILKP